MEFVGVGAMKEIWKDVRGYRGMYQVSNMGRVRSLERTILRKNGAPYKVQEKILSPRISAGYREVSLAKNGAVTPTGVHRLVLRHFVGPRPKNCDRVCHRDDDRSNNKLTNLYYGTASTNGKDWNAHSPLDRKGVPRGDRLKEVSKATIRKVRSLKRCGGYNVDIAVACKLSTTMVTQILNKRGRFKDS